MAGLLNQARSTLEGVKIAPQSGEIIYDNNVGKVSIDAVFPMGSEKWGTMDSTSRTQPRQFFNEKELESLAASIKEHGQQQPIVVRRAPASTHQSRTMQYGIVNGERRWRAMKMLGEREILVRIVNADTRGAYRLSIINDIHNISHNSLERGQSLLDCEQDMRDELEEFLAKHLPVALEQPLSQAGYERLQRVEHLAPIWMRRVFERAVKTERRPKVTDEDLALTVGITPKRIQDLTRLTTLESEFADALASEKINTRHAAALLRLPDKKTRKKLFKEILEDGLSGVDAELRAKEMNKPLLGNGGATGWTTRSVSLGAAPAAEASPVEPNAFRIVAAMRVLETQAQNDDQREKARREIQRVIDEGWEILKRLGGATEPEGKV